MTGASPASRVTTLAVGVLAGGQGTRAGGVDKGWIVRDGVAQIGRVLDAVARNMRVVCESGAYVRVSDRVLVSANRSLPQYEALGLIVVPDRWPGFQGPMAGIASLALACGASQPSSGAAAHDANTRPWLATLPVDVDRIPDDYLANMLRIAESMATATPPIVAADIERHQPLFALYSPLQLDAIVHVFDAGERSIARWQRNADAHIHRFPALRFGNLNTLQERPSA